MLKLKKLQILGFKSFCDRTELKFHGDGVAAIVGPNGCGKSNLLRSINRMNDTIPGVVVKGTIKVTGQDIY